MIATTTEGDKMPQFPTHKDNTDEYIELALDNAIDDMGDDGVDDSWIRAIATNRTMLLTLLKHRHRLYCSHLDELVACATCGDEADDMHLITCELKDWEDSCYNRIDDLIYSDFIRYRPDTD